VKYLIQPKSAIFSYYHPFPEPIYQETLLTHTIMNSYRYENASFLKKKFHTLKVCQIAFY